VLPNCRLCGIDRIEHGIIGATDAVVRPADHALPRSVADTRRAPARTASRTSGVLSPWLDDLDRGRVGPPTDSRLSGLQWSDSRAQAAFELDSHLHFKLGIEALTALNLKRGCEGVRLRPGPGVHPFVDAAYDDVPVIVELLLRALGPAPATELQRAATAYGPRRAQLDFVLAVSTMAGRRSG
jgi:hypothetical protein